MYPAIFDLIFQLFRVRKPLKFCLKRNSNENVSNSWISLFCHVFQWQLLDYFPKDFVKVRQWGIFSSKLWTELSTPALPSVTGFADACRSLQSSAAVPSRHFPINPDKFTNSPAMAWWGILLGSKTVSQMGILKIKEYMWKIMRTDTWMAREEKDLFLLTFNWC